MTYFAETNVDSSVARVIVCDSLQWVLDRLGGTWEETQIDSPTLAYAGIGAYFCSFSPPVFIPDWKQPVGSEDAYPDAAWVWHNGRAWRSLQAANVFEPGVASWREMLTEWPEWVQPTGAQDAYQIGEKITFQSQRYISLIDANVWSPTGYPAGWALQP